MNVSKMNRNSLLISVLLVFLLGGSFFLLTSRSQTKVPTVQQTTQNYFPYQFKQDGSSLYKLKLTQNSKIEQGKTPITYKFTIEAKLHTRVLKKETAFLYMAYQLSEFKLHSNALSVSSIRALMPYYTSMYIAKIDYSGAIKEIYFPGKKINFLGLSQLTHMIETINKKESSYLLTQKDSLGEYIAFYIRDKDSIKKQKKSYVKLNEAYEGYKVSVKKSYFDAKIDTKGNWLQSIELKEDLLLRDPQNYPFASNENLLSLVKISDKNHSQLEIDTENRSIVAILKEFTERRNRDKDIYQKLQQKSQRKKFKKNHVTIDSLVHSLKKSKDFRKLKEYITLFPQTTMKLKKYFQSFNDDTSMKTIAILEQVGSTQAQELLTSLTEDDETTQINKVRSLIALGGTHTLTADSYNNLAEISAIRGTQELNELSDTSLLALSSHADDDVVSLIKSQYYDSPSLSKEKNILYSMQNAGAENFLDEIDNSLNSSSIKVRHIAIMTLSNIKDLKQREALLKQQLTLQTNPKLKNLITALLKK